MSCVSSFDQTKLILDSYQFLDLLGSVQPNHICVFDQLGKGTVIPVEKMKDGDHSPKQHWMSSFLNNIQTAFLNYNQDSTFLIQVLEKMPKASEGLLHEYHALKHENMRTHISTCMDTILVIQEQVHHKLKEQFQWKKNREIENFNTFLEERLQYANENIELKKRVYQLEIENAALKKMVEQQVLKLVDVNPSSSSRTSSNPSSRTSSRKRKKTEFFKKTR